MQKRKPSHPGEILLEDVIKPLNLTITEAAKDLGISRKTFSEFVHQRTSLSTIMAIRIADATKTTPESWMNIQTKYDLWEVLQNKPNNIKEFRHLEVIV